MQRYNGRHYITLLICKPLVVYRFYCMVLYHTQTQQYIKNRYILNKMHPFYIAEEGFLWSSSTVIVSSRNIRHLSS